MRSGALSFLAGILLAQQLTGLPELWYASLALAGLAAIAVPRLRIAAFLALGFLWAVWRADLVLSDQLPGALEGENVILEGRIVGLPLDLGNAERFDVEVARLTGLRRAWPPPGRVRLTWYRNARYRYAQYRNERRPVPGEDWRLLARLKRPHGMMNPGGLDYEGLLFRQGVRATGYVVSGTANTRLRPAQGQAIERLRMAISDALRHRLGDRPETGIVTALAVGDQQAIGPVQWDVFNRTGTTHLVAISGLHVGFLGLIGYLLGRWLWSLPARTVLYLAAPRVGAVTGLLMAWGYAALAGFAVPAVRSLVMIAVVMIGLWSHRSWLLIDLLAAALWVVLLLDPLAVLAPGMWLSFGAVAILLYAMAGRVSVRGLWWRFGRVHWVMGLGLMPPLFFLFGQNPVLGPLANALAVPWVTFVVVPLVLLGTALLWVSEPLATLLLHGAVEALAWISDLPGGPVRSRFRDLAPTSADAGGCRERRHRHLAAARAARRAGAFHGSHLAPAAFPPRARTPAAGGAVVHGAGCRSRPGRRSGDAPPRPRVRHRAQVQRAARRGPGSLDPLSAGARHRAHRYLGGESWR